MYKIDIILTAIATTAITLFLLCFFCPDLFFSFLHKFPSRLQPDHEAKAYADVVLPSDTPITLKVIEKICSSKENENSNSVTFVFLMTNTSKKQIRSISGKLTIGDKNGEILSSFDCSFSFQSVGYGKSVTLQCGEIITDLSNKSGSALYNTALTKLSFSYEIDSLIYCSSEPSEKSEDGIYVKV